MDTSIVHLDGIGGEAVSPDVAGSQILIAVRVGYPGSRTTDILIGGQTVQVSNADLRKAHAIADAICDENFAGG